MDTAARGVWATMITPLRDDDRIDFDALAALVEWYIENRVSGLFAVCHSSESAYMTPDERLSLARFVVKAADGRVPVIAGANHGETFDEQVAEMAAIADSGVDALVLLSSKAAPETADVKAWREALRRLAGRAPEGVPLGLYESPSPYRRLVDPETLQWCSESGRFLFLKDTSCSLDNITAKLEQTRGGKLGIFNAHTQTLLASLRLGAAGYSSVMANVTPRLYDWLVRNYQNEPDRAERLQRFLSVADAAMVSRCYPVSAKYFLTLEGVTMSLHTRLPTRFPPDEPMKRTVEHLRMLNKEYLEAHDK